MSEFEQLVAEALSPRSSETDDIPTHAANMVQRRYAEIFAPRVAAAIQKAAIVAASKQADAHGGNSVAHLLGYDAALAVLRGEA